MKNLNWKFKAGLAMLVVVAMHYVGKAMGLLDAGLHGVILASSVTIWLDAAVGASPRKRGQSSKIAGSQVRGFAQTWEKAGSADGDGTFWYLVSVPGHAVLKDLKLNCDALTGFSDVDFGFLRLAADGTVTDDAKQDGTSGSALLADGLNPSAGYAIGSELDGLRDLDNANIGKTVAELLGYDAADPAHGTDNQFILAMHLVTGGTAAGTVSVRGTYLQG